MIPFRLPKAPAALVKESADTYGSFMERKRLIDQSFGIHGQQKEVVSIATEQ